MNTSSKKSLLYIVNFYGSPPLNYFEKYLVETDSALLTILKLPAVRSSKRKITIDAFIKDEQEKKHETTFNLFFPFPYFFVYFVQYLINFILVFVLLRKIRRKHFDIVIGETNFGSAVSFLLKKLGIAHYSVYFNGDILPDPRSSKKCFFLPNIKTSFVWFYKMIDTFLLKTQFFLRKIGYQNDLVWFCNDKIKKWDASYGLKSKDSIIYDPILIDMAQFKHYENKKKDMTALGYIGRIDDYVGFDIIIPALSKIKKTMPQIKLHLVGGSDIAFEKYKQLAKKYNVLGGIRFYGYLPKMEDAFNILSGCALGLALYKPTPDNVSMISQPAKPKEYIKVGIPVLVTKNGPTIGKEIVNFDAGVESNFTIEDVTATIIDVLRDKKRYYQLRQGVKKYAKINEYSRTLSKVWKEIVIKHNKQYGQSKTNY